MLGKILCTKMVGTFFTEAVPYFVVQTKGLESAKSVDQMVSRAHTSIAGGSKDGICRCWNGDQGCQGLHGVDLVVLRRSMMLYKAALEDRKEMARAFEGREILPYRPPGMGHSNREPGRRLINVRDQIQQPLPYRHCRLRAQVQA